MSVSMCMLFTCVLLSVLFLAEMAESAKSSKSLGWAGAFVEDYGNFYGFVKVTPAPPLPATPRCDPHACFF